MFIRWEDDNDRKHTPEAPIGHFRIFWTDDFRNNWTSDLRYGHSLDELWRIREECIPAISLQDAGIK